MCSLFWRPFVSQLRRVQRTNNDQIKEVETMKTTVEREGETLIVKIPLQQPVRSRSGKTFVVASTHGTIITDARYGKKRIVVTANAFIYPQEKKRSARKFSSSTTLEQQSKRSARLIFGQRASTSTSREAAMRTSGLGFTLGCPPKNRTPACKKLN
jgi:hypothetical protein